MLKIIKNSYYSHKNEHLKLLKRIADICILPKPFHSTSHSGIFNYQDDLDDDLMEIKISTSVITISSSNV